VQLGEVLRTRAPNLAQEGRIRIVERLSLGAHPLVDLIERLAGDVVG
jgi:hypothetical protein